MTTADQPTTADELLSSPSSPRPLPGTGPTPTACGHHHRIDTYARGCLYAHHLAGAVEAALERNPTALAVHTHACEADVWTLDDVIDPVALRDFIAGLHSGLEAHLRDLIADTHLKH